MKKIVFLLSLSLCVGFSAIAQDDEDEGGIDAAYASKRGVYLLPMAGDFALGIDATPLIKNVGSLFSSSEPSFNGVDQMIYGKFFLKDNRALRIKLGLNFENSDLKGIVPNDEEIANNPLNPNATLIDICKESGLGVQLGIGYEFRRGLGRVQGFYGGEIIAGFRKGKNSYEYANPMTTLNQDPNSYNFNWGSYTNMGNRVTEEKWGQEISAGFNFFLGVEYFFAPQMSLGGELGLGFRYNFTGQYEETSESWNIAADKVQTQTIRLKNDLWNAQNTAAFNYGGMIFLMFHF